MRRKGSLVFIHGLGSGPHVWGPQVREFGRDYDVGVCDLDQGDRVCRSITGSEASIDDYVTRLLCFLDRNCGEWPVVVGHFIGGTALLQLAARHSDKIDAVVVVGTAACYSKRADHPIGIGEDIFDGLGNELEASFADGVRRFADLQLTEPAPAELRAQWISSTESGITQADMRVCLSLMRGVDIREELKRIRTPTLIITGDRNLLVPPIAAQTLRDSIVDSQLQIVEEGGHIPQLTRPTRFNTILEGFLGQLRFERRMLAIYFSL